MLRYDLPSQVQHGNTAQVQQGRRRLNSQRHPEEVQRQTVAETVQQGGLQQGVTAARLLQPTPQHEGQGPALQLQPHLSCRVRARAVVVPP